MSSPREGALINDLPSFAADSSVAIPSDLQRRLSADGIDTPAALLRRWRVPPRSGSGAGSHGNGKDRTLGDDAQLAVDRLAAHAALATLNASPDLRTRLIDTGLLSGADLVEAGRRRVVALAGPDLAAEATQVQATAVTQGKVLDALLTAERLQAAADPATASTTTDCGCSDCRAATSPMAYLADLLGYVGSRVDVGDTDDPLLPETLARLLYQPLTDLPVECGPAQDDVSQVRLVVESLERLIAADLGGAPDVACGPQGHSLTFMVAADVDGDRQAELVLGFEPDPSSWLNGSATPLRSGLWVMRLDHRTGRWEHLRPGTDPAGPDGATFLFPAGMKATAGVALRLRRDAVVRRADRQQVMLTVEEDGVPGTRFWILQYEPEAATADQAWTHAVPGSFTAFGADLPAQLPHVEIVLAADVDGDGLDEVILCGSAPASGAGDPDHPAAVCVFDFDGQYWAPLCPPGSPYDIAYDVSPRQPFPIKLAATGDLDSNGRAEIVAALNGQRNLGKIVSVMGYDPATGQWNHVSPLLSDPSSDVDLWPTPWPVGALAVGSLTAINSPVVVAAPGRVRGADPNSFVVDQFSPADAGFVEVGTIDCTAQALPADSVVLADVDGDGHDELVVTTQSGQPDARYAAWVMKRDAAGSWQHLTPVPGHPLDADLVWTGSGQRPARIVLAADVNADGVDELVISGGDANAIWVLAYDRATQRWQHLSPVIPADGAEAAYALAAYRSLLHEAGTSYQELRQIAGSADADRTALAQRLGITGDPAALLLTPSQIRMPALESLFDLPSTRRDPFSDGPIGGTDAARVTRWSLSGARWSTDLAAASVAPDGRVYVRLSSGASTLTVTAYRDAARTFPVATGVAASDGTVRLAELSGSGLTGVLEVAGTGDANDLWLQVFPTLAVLRWQRLRELWSAEDDDGAFAGPVVDPDLIGPDDFRLPLAKAAPADPDRAFDVWLRRRAWSDALQSRLLAAGESLSALFDMMRATPPAADDPWRAAPDDVDGYLDELVAGLAADPERVAAATTAIGEVLYLPVDAFTRLIALRTVASAASGGPAGPTEQDWAEVRAILALAHKRSRAAAWRAEEAAAGIRLDAESFVAGPAMAEGEWPPSVSPLVDPDQVAITDLPVSIVGGRARTIWRRRVPELAANLTAVRDAGDWPAQLDAALGSAGPDPWPQWVATLAGELDSGDSQVVEAALARLSAATEGMSVTAFRRVAAVNAIVLADGVVTEQAQADVVRVLADARKVTVVHPRWRTEEAGLAYWQALRPALPRWLGSQQARQDWLTALAARTKAPALDPDMVARAGIRSAGSPAMSLWDARARSLFRLEQDTVRPLLTDPTADPLIGLDSALLGGLWTVADRAAVRAYLATGHTAAPGLLAAVFGTDANSFDSLVTALGAGGDDAAVARRVVLLELGFSTEGGFRDVVAVAGMNPQNVTAAQWATFDDTVSKAILLNVVTRAEYTADQLGVRVADLLAPTQLDLAAWQQVLGLRRLAAAGAALQPDETDSAVALLRRCVKRRAFGAWRDAERAAAVRIGPDSFIPPLDGGPLPGPVPAAVVAAEQRAWARVMAARSDQHDQVLPAIRDAVRRTEIATMPGYRDALVAALPVATGDPASWTETHLLVDVADNGERRTTRAAHAIDSILTLLWSLRTSQDRASHPQLRLDASAWDAEWRWIGSYATWRSAMLAFLYPENLLRPNLRRLQSPALRDALQSVRDARQLTVSAARRIAADYAQYFADVCRLDLAGMVCTSATAAACPVHLVPGTGQDRPVEVYVAVSSASRRVYWTMRDRSSEAVTAGLDLGFWQVMDQFTAGSVGELVGLDTYVPTGDPSAKRWLYLFAVTHGIGRRDLVFLRYDLDSSAGTWSAETTPLELPDGVSDFTATILPTAAGDPPRILLDVSDGDRTDRLVRSLDAKGENWARTEFVSLIGYGGWHELVPPEFATTGLGTVRQVLVGDFDGNHFDEVALISDTGSRMLRVGSNTAWTAMSSPSIRPEALVARGRFTLTNPTEYHDDLASIGRITPSRILLHHYDLLSGTWSTRGDTTAWQLPDTTRSQLMVLWATALTAGDFDGSGMDTLAVLGSYSSAGSGACAWLLRPDASGFQPINPDTPLARVRPAASFTAPQEREEVRIAFHLSATLPASSPVVPGLATVADVDGDGRDELVVVGSPTTEGPDRGNDLWIWDWHPELGWGPMARIGAQSLTRTVYDLGSDRFALIDVVAGDFDGDGRDEIACLVDAHDGAPPVVRVLDLTVPPYTADPATDGTWAELPVIDLRQADSPVRFGTAADVDGGGADELVLVGDSWLQIRALDRRLGRWVEFPLTGSGLGGTAAFVAAGKLDAANVLAPRRRPRRGARIRGAADQFAVGGGRPSVFTPDPDVLWQQRHPLGIPDSTGKARRFAVTVPTRTQCQPGWVTPTFVDPEGWILDDRVPETHRATRSRQAVTANTGAPTAVRRVIEEAFYDLPVAVALALQSGHDYEHALDWFRLVYDFTRPPEERAGFYGLVLDAQSRSPDDDPDPATYQRALLDWVQDPLDPYAVAAIRPFTHTRGTLQLLIRCLLDAADAEFTQDTAESVERARVLYQTARELLGDPALHQHFGPCEDVVAQVPPGTPAAARLGQSLLDGAEDRIGRHHQLLGSGVPLAGLSSDGIDVAWAALPSPVFCVSPNPILTGLRLHAELNLFKLRTGRNIAGMRRALDAYAAPTDQSSGLPVIGADGELTMPGLRPPPPTPYRYSALVQQAQQLAGQARDVEAMMLAALEKRDAEAQNLLRARQDVRVARAGIRLQDLRVTQAQDRVTVVQLQQERAHLEEEHYQQVLAAGQLQYEREALGWLEAASVFQIASAVASFASAATSLTAAAIYDPSFSVGARIGSAASALSSVAGGLGSLAGNAATWSTISSMRAGFARSQQEWQLRQQLAGADRAIAGAQVSVETDGVRVAEQERLIGELNADTAEQLLDFHQNKFTNVELYDWMSGVLDRAYRWFLQQATAMAQLAAAQLAFERQQGQPPPIQADYWEPPGAGGPGTLDDAGPDRHGLTGATRLIQDIAELEQYAFSTDQRRQQLTTTISLAALDPLAMAALRRDGVTTFATPMQLFDAAFPGHYLRLIRRVTVSVIALVSPVDGIHATLSASGISRVVVGPDVFSTVVLHRPPESVALTAALGAGGMFTFEPQTSGLRDPFEGLGLDTTWEIRLPRAANLFDFTTIADVLVTVDYTALDSDTYRQQVLRELDSSRDGQRGLSLRHEFPDAWWDLMNPASAADPMRVSVTTTTADFPPNLDELAVQDLAVALVTQTPPPARLGTVTLRFTESGAAAQLGGPAGLVDSVVSTQRGNGGPWLPITGKSPIGHWDLAFPDGEEIRAWLAGGGLLDVLLVVGYAGRTPLWPA